MSCLKTQITIFIIFIYSFVFSQSKITTFEIQSKTLKCKKKIWVYLPKNYNQNKQTFPVIYMPDGENLFNTQQTDTNNWQINKTLDSINAKVIVIGIAQSDKKDNGLITIKNEENYSEHANNYLNFIVNTLKPKIDSIYKTKTTPKNTCIFGSEINGLTAFYASIKYPNVFGKIGCFSPTFSINKPEIKKLLNETKVYNAKIYLMCNINENNGKTLNDINEIETIINTKRCECKYLNKKQIIKNEQNHKKLWREQFAKAYLWLF